MNLYEVCSNDPPGVKTDHAPGVTSWNTGPKEDHLQNSCSLTLEGIELWYLVFSISLWSLTNSVHMMTGGHKLEHRNKEAHFQNSFSLKLGGLELWYFICNISLWTSTKIVHMMPLVSKLAQPEGSQVGTQDQRRPSSKFLFSVTGRWRALIFGI